jgi:hypothetical protein
MALIIDPVFQLFGDFSNQYIGHWLPACSDILISTLSSIPGGSNASHPDALGLVSTHAAAKTRTKASSIEEDKNCVTELDRCPIRNLPQFHR